MKEFMFYIRNEKDAKESLSETEHTAFIKSCEAYINDLTAKNKMIAAQPLVRQGFMISRNSDGWNSEDIKAMSPVQVGYYHIRAADLEEAIEIAKQNPEFQYVPSASIEVREVKIKELKTGFVYPKSS